MNNPSYIIVFHGIWKNQKIVDIGDAPCFKAVPTLGICRSNFRQYVKLGATLFFVAKIGNEYFLKG